MCCVTLSAAEQFYDPLCWWGMFPDKQWVTCVAMQEDAEGLDIVNPVLLMDLITSVGDLSMEVGRPLPAADGFMQRCQLSYTVP